jgi:hypothetical protein
VKLALLDGGIGFPLADADRRHNRNARDGDIRASMVGRDDDEGLLAVRAKLKGGKMRYVPMPPELAVEILRYPAVFPYCSRD